MTSLLLENYDVAIQSASIAISSLPHRSVNFLTRYPLSDKRIFLIYRCNAFAAKEMYEDAISDAHILKKLAKSEEESEEINLLLEIVQSLMQAEINSSSRRSKRVERVLTRKILRR